ncbi:hypothetical protein BOSE62_71032 [Bosea sp. 62]|nr:hypothetical protein BOSE7B_60050 [Bosea sp. 7B]CAD5297252.1 hypothetical protein BOSE21B_90613 [Bosea sp. 21B]CAD5297539.1 hypothetical protein BOSE46_80695 [Bosea sp. 46]VVT61262.1 hypothetical protein BOS5A_230539 [Bosea sp. EC-HK365B]VXB22022.1 hypothetical protein BOSE125_130220 [Bosea sp. 125]VXB22480.1 hypothetical protein BOSE127_110050 [Bosea sp. 127]VXC81267.1 hypothetical protein BOSE29B_80580 [Bosea sp. 29B]VXC85537.1 hypothetical protein BOSE62_71032 [Bosea sp. 62]
MAVLLRDLLDRDVEAVLGEDAGFLGEHQRREAGPAGNADGDLGLRLRATGGHEGCKTDPGQHPDTLQTSHDEPFPTCSRLQRTPRPTQPDRAHKASFVPNHVKCICKPVKALRLLALRELCSPGRSRPSGARADHRRLGKQ